MTLRSMASPSVGGHTAWAVSLLTLSRRRLREELTGVAREVACWSSNGDATSRRCALLGAALCLPMPDARRCATLGVLAGVADTAEMPLWGFDGSAADLGPLALSSFAMLHSGPLRAALDGCPAVRSLGALDRHGWVLTDRVAALTAAGLAPSFAGRFDELVETAGLLHS